MSYMPSVPWRCRSPSFLYRLYRPGLPSTLRDGFRLATRPPALLCRPLYANALASRARPPHTSPSAALRRPGRDPHDTTTTGHDITVNKEAGSLTPSNER